MKEQSPQYIEDLMSERTAKKLLTLLILTNLGLFLADQECGAALIPPTVALTAIIWFGQNKLKKLKKDL